MTKKLDLITKFGRLALLYIIKNPLANTMEKKYPIHGCKNKQHKKL